MKNIGNEINHLLLDRKIGRQDLANALGMSVQNLHRILSEKKVRGDLYAGTLEKIARVLKVNIGHFFDDDVNGFPMDERTAKNEHAAAVTNTVKPEVGDILQAKLLNYEQQIDLLRKQAQVQQELESWLISNHHK